GPRAQARGHAWLENATGKECDRAPAPMEPAYRPRSCSIPRKRAAVLIFDDARLEEILLLLEVHRLAHPWEGIVGIGKHRREPELGAAPVGDDMHIGLAQRRIQAEKSARHGVPPIGGF